MVTQPDLPGLPVAAAGAMQEQTFNEALAEALRQRRVLWRGDPGSVLGERLRMLADAERERPDILVAPADIYPVIVEVEFGEPALGDARAKLGRLVVGTNDRVRAAIAVGVPPAVRGWSVGQLRERLAEPDGVELRLALLYAGPTGTNADASIWLTSLRDAGLQNIAQIRSANFGVIAVSALRSEWDKILKVNYGAIFNTARPAPDDQMPVRPGVPVAAGRSGRDGAVVR